MDVHRSRFVPYPVSPITATSFSRSNDRGLRAGQPQPALKLAIGRQNGDIEIWDPVQGQWLQESVFPGDGRSIDGLAWTRDPDELDAEGQLSLGQHRLFSIASSPAVTEWDLEQGRPKKQSTGNFSEVWCLAPQPRREQKAEEEEPKCQDVVAGCGDGTIVLLTTADNDLQFKRFVARVSGKKAKCVSIAYQDQERIVAGFMDSTIRIFDTRNGSNVRTMSLGNGLPGAPRTTIVWQVRSLPNGDIVSGDSSGQVCFWDGRSHSLSQRIKAHDSECLDLVVSADGETVLSGSMDGRIAILRQTTTAGGRRSWAKSHHKKTHDGQIKAMSAFDSKGLSVVVSGGDDLAPTVTPLREFGMEHSRNLPTLPQASPIRSARHSRLLVSWWDKSISIWRLSHRAETATDSDEANPPRKLVAKLLLEVKDRLRDVYIADSGKVLAATTGSETRVFQLRQRPHTDRPSIRRLEVPKALASSGARMLRISPDGRWLAVVSLENEVQVVRLAADASKPKNIRILQRVVELDRREPQKVTQSSFRQYERGITKLDFAPNSSVLACGDHSGHLDSWVLEGHEDLTAPPIDVSQQDSRKGDSDKESDSSDDDDDDGICIFYGQHWSDNPVGQLLPKLESAPLVFSFRPVSKGALDASLMNGNPGIHSTRHNPHAHSHELPQGQHLLWIMTAQHKIYEIDVLQGRLSDWSRRNPSSVLPEDFHNLMDRVKDAVWDVGPRRERLWLFGSTWTFMLNVGTDLAQPSRRKRKTEEHTEGAKRLKTSSGAGGTKPSNHRIALPEKVKRYEAGAWADLTPSNPRSAHDEDDNMNAGVSEDEEEEEEEAEDRLRLARTTSDSPADKLVQDGTQQHKWWCTFKYRPVLGVVPLEDDTVPESEKVLEVVVVERPLWDAKRARK